MADIDAKIKAQGDKIRELKAAKSAKDVIEPEVKTLLALKADFKAATGQDWKPGMTVPEAGKASSPAPASGSSSPGDLNTAIGAQGDIVRKLKADKAAKPEIEAAVKKLLALKADFKAATGQDWKPGMSVPAAASGGATEDKGAEVDGKIKAQGDKVRQLKTDKAEKSEIEAAVKTLLELKAEYKAATGKDWKPPAAGGEKKAEADKVKVAANIVTFTAIICIL